MRFDIPEQKKLVHQRLMPLRWEPASMHVTNPGRSSFDTCVTLERSGEPGVFYATGGATTVWLNIPQGKTVPMPDWLRQLIT